LAGGDRSRPYADAFETNDIDTNLLTRLDDQLLKDIGVSSAGHRLRLRDAIAKLTPISTTVAKAGSSVDAAPEAPVASAERRQLTVMDAQWSDPTSLELYDLIIDRVPALRVLLIITFRPEFTPPWIGRPRVTLCALNRLAPRQRAEMIAGITGGKALPEEIAAQIVDRTDGVPLFVEVEGLAARQPVLMLFEACGRLLAGRGAAGLAALGGPGSSEASSRAPANKTCRPRDGPDGGSSVQPVFRFAGRGLAQDPNGLPPRSESSATPPATSSRKELTKAVVESDMLTDLGDLVPVKRRKEAGPLDQREGDRGQARPG
jgi:hypothetical protein